MRVALRTWLKQEPYPYRVKAELESGESKTVKINESKSRWRDAEAALKGATYCEALDRDGETLRVWGEDESAEDVAKRVVKEGRTELAELARLLVESADLAAQRHQEAYSLGFNALVGLVKILSERLQGLERAWHGLLMSQQGQEEGQPAAGPVNEQMILGLLAAHLQRQGAPPQMPQQQPRPSNGSNGAAK